MSNVEYRMPKEIQMSNVELPHSSFKLSSFFRHSSLDIRDLAFIILCVPALSGCRQSISSIHGKVTYEGAPIQRGQITFAPADRRGVARSGPIESGKYTVENVPPGRKIVMISSISKPSHVPKSHAEMDEMAKRGPPAAPDSADEVPANAVGNNASIETTQGVQEYNFDLKRPKGG
jgi:hypothetical protein